MLKYYRLVGLLSIFVLVLSCSNAPSSSSSSSSSSSAVNPSAFYGTWYCYKMEYPGTIVNYTIANSPTFYKFKSDGTADWWTSQDPTISTVPWSVSGNVIRINTYPFTYSFSDSNHFYLSTSVLKYYYEKY